jgi:ParB family chromosome partitioning protein
VALSKIRPNHLQPRRYFDPEKLAELSGSIKEHGLAQPLLVSPNGDGTYELIAGERRLRASELAGLSEVDVFVRTPTDEKQRLALALIENLQREDLNSIETALGYLRLMKEFGINQTQLGEAVGKSKASISNTLRMLELPDEIQKALQHGTLTEGHGRALLMVQDASERRKLFSLAVERKLSVREVEDLARRLNGGDTLEPRQPKAAAPEKPADLRALETALQHALGTKVEIKTRKDATKGAITIHFYSLDEFDKLIRVFKK